MPKVCFYTTRDLISGGELGSEHCQTTIDYELTAKPDGPGYVCTVTNHSVYTNEIGEISGYDQTYTGNVD